MMMPCKITDDLKSIEYQSGRPFIAMILIYDYVNRSKLVITVIYMNH